MTWHNLITWHVFVGPTVTYREKKLDIEERENSLCTVSSVQCLQVVILPTSFEMAPQPASRLSREEEAELTRSNKKVKDVRHAGFVEEQGSSTGSLEAGKAFTSVHHHYPLRISWWAKSLELIPRLSTLRKVWMMMWNQRMK